ncbi:peptidylprolyl isomerase [Labedaea rhizosphaerae]|uniref:Peptidyl-prolyl cis-trans isomerase n=1 Tax=Labedaea rhizosphaerae TaxID=598644 RepID=A0A4R6SI84_LABRH|nr:peptidylprolyl isomerase [Labedaea rhizosphaerae]TDQ01300.1 peptidyl-prolyl cis-trans isomerase B (cyclophilin B) [Labedaea rhizosphaerae]
MRTRVTAALVCAALLAAGCTEKTTGAAKAIAAPPTTTAPSVSVTTPPVSPDTSQPASADFPSSIPSTRATEPTRPTPLPATVKCDYVTDTGGSPAKVVAKPGGQASSTGTQTVALITGVGQISIKLNRALAPCTVNNFLSLARQGYFDNTTCHRMTTVDTLQVLQCGDPTGQGTGGPGYSFDDELFDGMTYGRGIVAMANAGPNTNGSQFFIIYGDSSALQPTYTIFGSVDEASLQVIDTVAKSGVNPTNGPGDGPPVMPVTIASTTIN